MNQKSIKNIRREFRKTGVFYTPPEIAEKMKTYVDFEPRDVYDPACGAGNLLSVFPEGVKKYGQELDAGQLALIDLPNFTGHVGDTLAQDGFAGMEFHCILANPPFSTRWEPEKLKDDVRFRVAPVLPPPSRADWAFMLHILHHLSHDGIAVVLEFPGILYRGQSEGKIRKWFVENNYIDRVVHIPGNTFEDTSIATCMVVLRKDRITSDILFEDGKRSKKVSRSEVEEENFDLSVSRYLPTEEIEKEEINPLELELHARQSFLKILKGELEFEKRVCAMEEISMQPFLTAIKYVVESYEP